MKNYARFLCMALCLCMLPVFGIAASADTMTSHEASGVPYYIRSDWSEPVFQEEYTYYYKDPVNPQDGFVMIMELDMADVEIPAGGEAAIAALESAVAGLEQDLGSPVTSEPLDIDGRKGLYFFGSMGDHSGLAGYVTMSGSAFIAIVVLNPAMDEAVVRPLLMEVLGIDR